MNVEWVKGLMMGRHRLIESMNKKLGGGNEHDISGACEKTGPRGSCWQMVGNEPRPIDWD